MIDLFKNKIHSESFVYSYLQFRYSCAKISVCYDLTFTIKELITECILPKLSIIHQLSSGIYIFLNKRNRNQTRQKMHNKSWISLAKLPCSNWKFQKFEIFENKNEFIYFVLHIGFLSLWFLRWKIAEYCLKLKILIELHANSIFPQIQVLPTMLINIFSVNRTKWLDLDWNVLILGKFKILIDSIDQLIDWLINDQLMIDYWSIDLIDRYYLSIILIDWFDRPFNFIRFVKWLIDDWWFGWLIDLIQSIGWYYSICRMIDWWLISYE